uniref:Uncharacterized protein n=1 Tax=Anguilla anguilla TaxID=7936 RepID=A0A0E9WLQ0_ANGAN
MLFNIMFSAVYVLYCPKVPLLNVQAQIGCVTIHKCQTSSGK